MKKLLLMFFVMMAAGVFSAQPMNVVFILADDLGWADTTLYGHTHLYETPNLERLAKRGMVFNRAYSNSPLCSPTRASILTGQTPARHGSTSPCHHQKPVRLKPELKTTAKPGEKVIQPLSVSRLDTKFPTLGKLLKARGYATAHFGKWHLGSEPYSPLEHGFDVDIPHHSGPGPAGSYLAPWKFKHFKANKPKEHIEDRMAQEAVKWMKSVKQKPFFMNYWMFSVHAPFDAKPELIERYRKKIDPNDPQHSPTYAAMVHSMDDAVGTLMDAVDAAGLTQRTIFIFTSDNGGNMYNSVDGTTPTSNAPLRGGKATVFEGGIRVPCIVVWPGVTKPGSRSDEIIQASDFYTTILSGLGIPLPENYPVDGIDIIPALRGGKLNRRAIFTYFPHSPPVPDWLPPSIAVHVGDWKLIRLFHQGENGAHAYRLYNLKNDIGERNNLAASHPEKVKTLDAMIEDYLRDCGTVVPVPNPHFDPAQYHPERIGVQPGGLKQSGNKKKKLRGKPGKSNAKPGEWTARKVTSLKKGDEGLLLISTGEDPGMDVNLEKPCRASQISVRMKYDGKPDKAFFFWKTDKGPIDGRISFDVSSGDQWETYNLKLPNPTDIIYLRFDPIRKPGRVWIGEISLLNEKGHFVKKWSF